ncbi:response regulator [Cytophagaceae bacterium ABcell3]|nr:response regulator [Cytophagaceae bacterium ABcell3]
MKEIMINDKLEQILIIDDDQAHNYVATRVIEKMKIADKVKTFANSKEALEYILKQCEELPSGLCPELIFIDFFMPAMDAEELMRRLQDANFSNWDKVVFIGMSAVVKQESQERLFELGVRETVEKPLSTEKVKDIYSRYFAKQIT